MSGVAGSYRAIVADPNLNGNAFEQRDLSTSNLPSGEITIEVEYSSLNYKDMLAFHPESKVVRNYPIVPGIDLAGTVVESASEDIAVGTKVMAHGYSLGTGQDGGYAEYARVPASWVVPLSRLSPKEAMRIGTAGFTAAMSVLALESANITPSSGRILVTGASGGVGSCAVDILSAAGFEVVASSGKAPTHESVLRNLGAAEVIGRVPTGDADEIRPLSKSTWAGAVDTVGGKTLAYVISTLHHGGLVAASGNAGGASLPTTVLPFILRGVCLQGIDSVVMSIERRKEIWQRIENDLLPSRISLVSDEVEIKHIDTAISRMSSGKHDGRTVVKVKGGF